MNITVIYYTPNLKNSLFYERIRDNLKKTVGNIPIISVTQKPLVFGENICIGEIGRSYRSVYKQMLIGAKAAYTDYVMMAEDDTLYPPDHFDKRNLPPLDAFGYNMARWSVCTWLKDSVYSITNRLCNSNMIAPRKLLIELLEKRFAKFPDGGNEPGKVWSEPGKHDNQYSLGMYKIHQYIANPTVSFIHPNTLAFEFLGTRKKINPIRAYDIPIWGNVKHLMSYYYEGK